ECILEPPFGLFGGWLFGTVRALEFREWELGERFADLFRPDPVLGTGHLHGELDIRSKRGLRGVGRPKQDMRRMVEIDEQSLGMQSSGVFRCRVRQRLVVFLGAYFGFIDGLEGSLRIL